MQFSSTTEEADMMSTALMATIGLERTEAGLPVPDQNDDNGMSFAESFAGRLNVAASEGAKGDRLQDGAAVRFLGTKEDSVASDSGGVRRELLKPPMTATASGGGVV